jgi:hypothetical protein
MPNKRPFSKDILIKRLWREISWICADYELSWAKGSSQVANSRQEKIEAYGEIRGLLKTIEIIEEKQYRTS